MKALIHRPKQLFSDKNADLLTPEFLVNLPVNVKKQLQEEVAERLQEINLEMNNYNNLIQLLSATELPKPQEANADKGKKA